MACGSCTWPFSWPYNYNFCPFHGLEAAVFGPCLGFECLSPSLEIALCSIANKWRLTDTNCVESMIIGNGLQSEFIFHFSDSSWSRLMGFHQRLICTLVGWHVQKALRQKLCLSRYNNKCSKVLQRQLVKAIDLKPLGLVKSCRLVSELWWQLPWARMVAVHLTTDINLTNKEEQLMTSVEDVSKVGIECGHVLLLFDCFDHKRNRKIVWFIISRKKLDIVVYSRNTVR